MGTILFSSHKTQNFQLTLSKRYQKTKNDFGPGNRKSLKFSSEKRAETKSEVLGVVVVFVVTGGLDHLLSKEIVRLQVLRPRLHLLPPEMLLDNQATFLLFDRLELHLLVAVPDQETSPEEAEERGEADVGASKDGKDVRKLC